MTTSLIVKLKIIHYFLQFKLSAEEIFFYIFLHTYPYMCLILLKNLEILTRPTLFSKRFFLINEPSPIILNCIELDF